MLRKMFGLILVAGFVAGTMGTSCGLSPLGGFASGPDGICVVSPLGIVCWPNSGQTDANNGGDQSRSGPVITGGTVNPDGSITLGPDGSLTLDWSNFDFPRFWPQGRPPFHLEIDGPNGTITIQPEPGGNGLIFIWKPSGSGTFTVCLVDRDGRRFCLPPIIVIVSPDGTTPPPSTERPVATITAPPNDTVLNIGQAVTFTATVTKGTGPFKYHWLFPDGTIADVTTGEMTSSVVKSFALPQDSGQTFLEVTGANLQKSVIDDVRLVIH